MRSRIGGVLGMVIGSVGGFFGCICVLAALEADARRLNFLFVILIIAAMIFGGAVGRGLGKEHGIAGVFLTFISTFLFVGFANWVSEHFNRTAFPKPQADSRSIATVSAALVAITLVMVMRSHMIRLEAGQSRVVLYYKIWHYPALVIGNFGHPDFWMLSGSVCLTISVIILCVVAGYLLGAIGGVTSALIGAVVGIFLGVLSTEFIMRRLVNEDYLKNLREDMLTPSTNLVTIEPHFVFPVLCAAQSAVLFGIVGAAIGGLIQTGEVNLPMFAVVSAFFGFFCAQLLAHFKTTITDRFQLLSLSLVQGVVLAVLLLPARRLLGHMPTASWILEQVTNGLGSRLTLDTVFVVGVGLATTIWGNLCVDGKNS